MESPMQPSAERLQEARRFWEISRTAGTELLKHGLTLAVGVIAALFAALTSNAPDGVDLDRGWARWAVIWMGLAAGGGLLAWAADVGLHASWAYRVYNSRDSVNAPVFPHPAWRWLRISGLVILVLCFLSGTVAGSLFVLSATERTAAQRRVAADTAADASTAHTEP